MIINERWSKGVDEGGDSPQTKIKCFFDHVKLFDEQKKIVYSFFIFLRFSAYSEKNYWICACCFYYKNGFSMVRSCRQNNTVAPIILKISRSSGNYFAFSSSIETAAIGCLAFAHATKINESRCRISKTRFPSYIKKKKKLKSFRIV